MKIAIDARFYGPENGGLGRYTMNLVEQLARLDHKNNYVLLLRPDWFTKVQLPKNFKKSLIKSRHYSLMEQVEVRQVLLKINPDITHFLHFNVPIFFNGKFVLTIHDLLMHQGIGKSATTLPSWKYQVKRLGYRRVFDHAVNAAHQIIVPSRFVKEELQKTYPSSEQKTQVIYEGVSYSKEGKTKTALETTPYFLYVGNAYPHKNIGAAIQAIVQLNKENENTTKLLLVTPRDVFTNRLKEVIHKSGAEKYVVIKSLVRDTELFNLYRYAVAFVYPSFSEGFGLQGLEAMHAKTRLIASDIPVFHEIYGTHALYINPNKPDQITDAFKKLLEESDEKREKGIIAAKKYSSRYSWEKMTSEVIEKYKALSK